MAQTMLAALGQEIFVSREGDLDMATALSGTGPAYVFLFMEALIDAGVHMGFSRRVAEQLVLQTVKGSVDFALASDSHLAELRNQVTSPGGTTADALYFMEKGGLRTVMSKAVFAAFKKSRALSTLASEEDDES
jgi:pyrroline-5-carboxylate reductase